MARAEEHGPRESIKYMCHLKRRQNDSTVREVQEIHCLDGDRSFWAKLWAGNYYPSAIKKFLGAIVRSNTLNLQPPLRRAELPGALALRGAGDALRGAGDALRGAGDALR